MQSQSKTTKDALIGNTINKTKLDFDKITGLSLYRVQPVAAGCIIGWDAAMPLMQCPPYQYTGAHFADLGRMTG